MIKYIFKRREASDTYLTHVCRWSRQITMKVDASLAAPCNTLVRLPLQLMKATVLAESS